MKQNYCPFKLPLLASSPHHYLQPEFDTLLPSPKTSALKKASSYVEHPNRELAKVLSERLHPASDWNKIWGAIASHWILWINQWLSWNNGGRIPCPEGHRNSLAKATEVMCHVSIDLWKQSSRNLKDRKHICISKGMLNVGDIKTFLTFNTDAITSTSSSCQVMCSSFSILSLRDQCEISDTVLNIWSESCPFSAIMENISCVG